MSGLTAEEFERYSRQLVLPEWSGVAQARLAQASVLVIGAGALGSPVASYLAAAGVGRLGILDSDTVELSNLQRQTLHFTPDVGVPKALSAAAKLEFLNPEIVVDPYPARLEADNAAELVAGHDLVVDCSDTFATRYLANAACCAAGIDLIEGGLLAFEALVMAIRPRAGACYRCAFPEPPAAGSVLTCAQAGVLGPAAGVAGSLMALEALKLLGGIDAEPFSGFLSLDLRAPALTRVAVQRRADCPDCS